MTENKRFNVFDVDGTIFLEDHKEGSYHIGEIGNVDVNCLNDIADRLNGLAEENDVLRKQLKTKHVTGHLKKSDVKDSHLIIDGNEVNCKIEELRASGYSDEYINKELGHLVNWRI